MNPQKINELDQKINNLLYRQTVVYNEIKQLENELAELKRQNNFSSVSAANKNSQEDSLWPSGRGNEFLQVLAGLRRADALTGPGIYCLPICSFCTEDSWARGLGWLPC